MKGPAKIATLVALSLACNAIAYQTPAEETVQLAQMCSKKMGPYASQYAAQAQLQGYQAKGYSTSGVWVEGGVVSSWSNRRYFFNVYYPC